MVIKDILEKVSNADPNDPKVKQLREKLAKLKGEDPEKQQAKAQKKPAHKDAPGPGDQEQRSKPQAQQKKAAPQPDDDIEQLAKASEQERRRYAQNKNPRLRVKEERTHKLVAKQVGELIELTTELQKRLTKQEQENKSLHQEIERVEKRNEEIKEKMELIDGRLEKFMGLYEVITNQYNPFAEQDSTAQSVPESARSQAAGEKRTVNVSDGLKGEEQHVPIEQGEMSSENKQKINRLLAELEAQENQEISENEDEVQESEVREQELAEQLREELHGMFSGFEGRMKQYLDESVQSQLHQTLGDLENVLNDEIEEAVVLRSRGAPVAGRDAVAGDDDLTHRPDGHRPLRGVEDEPHAAVEVVVADACAQLLGV